MEIDRFSGIPAYRQVADWLRGQILSGDIPPTEPIPSKAQLKRDLGIGSQTVDKALGILKDEGLLRWARGLGLYPVPESERVRSQNDY